MELCSLCWAATPKVESLKLFTTQVFQPFQCLQKHNQCQTNKVLLFVLYGETIKVAIAGEDIFPMC